MKGILLHLYNKCCQFFIESRSFLLLWFYLQLYTPWRVWIIRKKKNIRVLFVLHELGSWKTERLYLKMLEHIRFEPLLLSVPSIDNDKEIYNVQLYLKKKGYHFETIEDDENICKKFHPDIIFYQKPYNACIPWSHLWFNNMKSLFCIVPYCPLIRLSGLYFNQPLNNVAWQYYVENRQTKEELIRRMKNHGRNVLATGTPVMDGLMEDKCFYINPWKNCDKKKRIIFAPHHNADMYPTIQKYGDFILMLAEKYCEKVQWAFKPHPLLYTELRTFWDQSRIDEYYRKWEELENSQVELGDYMGLFKYSDAIIHDCESFAVEYLYLGKPAMYLKEVTERDISVQQKDAISCHYFGRCCTDIEDFVIKVINGNDCMEKDRYLFKEKYLKIPYGTSAVDNIISSILS